MTETKDQQQQTPLIDPKLIDTTAKQVPVTAPSVTAKRKPTADQLGPKEYCWGVGRRKSAVARVRIRPGQGKITINGKDMQNFFPRLQDQKDIKAPLKAVDQSNAYDIFVNVKGGGQTGQAGAVVLGVARALVVADPEVYAALKDGAFLTRDGRMKERKKYGQKRGSKKIPVFKTLISLLQNSKGSCFTSDRSLFLCGYPYQNRPNRYNVRLLKLGTV